MHKGFKIPLVAAIFSLGLKVCAPAQDHLERTTTVGGSQYLRVFEHLSHSSSQDSRVLTLSSLPILQLPIHIFRNGLELVPGKDFTLQGQTVSVISTPADGRDVVFQAAYFVTSDDAPTNFARSVPSKAVGSRILSTYLSRSLDQELDSLSESNKQSVSEGTILDESQFRPPSRGFERRMPRQADPEPESMRMLRDLTNSRAVAARGARRKGAHAVVDIDGLEGVGDEAVTSPYDILSSRPGGLAAALNELDASRRTRSIRKGREKDSPRSEQMLRETLRFTY